MTLETFDQSDEKTWPDPKRPTFLHTYPPTYLITHWATFDFLATGSRIFLATGASFWIVQCALTIAAQDNPAFLWHLRHWLQFLQLKNWIHYNICYLTIKSDTGQHSQFLRCLIQEFVEPMSRCYTTDPKKRWEYCDVPLYKDYLNPATKGADYTGKISKTKSGRDCQVFHPHPIPNTQSPFFTVFR